jgi:hypothetical protein
MIGLIYPGVSRLDYDVEWGTRAAAIITTWPSE